ncbi:hypothetical protein L6452_34146 [Arctium lappa]|uniref:Uncharacterized protein n=1 Tax=Arctium lappa TaxID=4217 RepID=A0ACB8YHD2_ARCLA|nr:hypothetical protein L6452_34146 [Arctium lappa]
MPSRKTGESDNYNTVLKRRRLIHLTKLRGRRFVYVCVKAAIDEGLSKITESTVSVESLDQTITAGETKSTRSSYIVRIHSV